MKKIYIYLLILNADSIQRVLFCLPRQVQIVFMQHFMLMGVALAYIIFYLKIILFLSFCF